MNNLMEERLAETLVAIFDDLFEKPLGTVLRGGADEPFYEPGSPSKVWFRYHYPRSALHEVSHWCLAGASRRRLPDYGYWYAPEGRNKAQQAAFFAVEVKPQAIESLFCEALDMPFDVSIDNLDSPPASEEVVAFRQRVIAQSAQFRCRGLPHRAHQFLSRLQAFKGEERVA